MNIPNLKVSFTLNERKWITDRIDECLSCGQISQGKYVSELENKFAEYTSIRNAIAVNSGSSAIEVVMRVLEVNGKEVLVPTNTFMATATGVMFPSGKVKLMDTDTKTFSTSLAEIRRRVTKNTVGVIVVHIGGIVTPEIEDIRDWCNQQGIWLFEDCAHAHGSSLNGMSAGSFGIAGGYSLFATKIITSGEGGIIVTNDDVLAEKIRLFRNHGKPRNWETYHTHIGSNYRMSDLTAIFALSQLNRLNEIIKERARIANIYTKMISELIPSVTPILPLDKCSWYKYIVLLPNRIDRNILKEKLMLRGIELQGEVYQIPLHNQPIAHELGFENYFPNADNICRNHICLPIYPELTDEQAEIIINQLHSVISELESIEK